MDTPLTSPWQWIARDYQSLAISISITFDETTHALLDVGGACTTVHRDSGCQYNTIVLDNPADSAKAKLLPAPADGKPDVSYSTAQLARQGLSTIDDVLAVQITAEP